MRRARPADETFTTYKYNKFDEKQCHWGKSNGALRLSLLNVNIIKVVVKWLSAFRQNNVVISSIDTATDLPWYMSMKTGQ